MSSRTAASRSWERHLLDSHQRGEDEVRLLLTFVRPGFDVARLAAVRREPVEKLQLGGQAATDALTEDIDHTGRAALLTALRRAEESSRLLGH
ncbi:hypothetical protein ACSHWB_40250 [Lentzea sp. HUAS TT2]|uniref:hypothetical protein n=1 Tax=Lentzea sp. HUAS TT2 TaxID=3447454 RepID=UPI003F70C1F1